MKKFTTYCWRFYWSVSIIVEIVYLLLRAMLTGLRMLLVLTFTGPQDEKPSTEVIEAEDQVLDAGGGFCDRSLLV